MAKKHHPPSQNLVPAAVIADTPHSFKRFLAAAILILSTAIVYHPSLKVPFLLDDYGKIIRNPDIKSLDNISSRLIYPYESPPEFNRNDPSRPLTYLTLTLNYHFNHLEPYGYHVVNIALHALVGLLIFVLASLLFPLVGVSDMAPPIPISAPLRSSSVKRERSDVCDWKGGQPGDGVLCVSRHPVYSGATRRQMGNRRLRGLLCFSAGVQPIGAHFADRDVSNGFLFFQRGRPAAGYAELETAWDLLGTSGGLPQYASCLFWDARRRGSRYASRQ